MQTDNWHTHQCCCTKCCSKPRQMFTNAVQTQTRRRQHWPCCTNIGLLRFQSLGPRLGSLDITMALEDLWEQNVNTFSAYQLRAYYRRIWDALWGRAWTLWMAILILTKNRRIWWWWQYPSCLWYWITQLPWWIMIEDTKRLLVLELSFILNKVKTGILETDIN